MQDCCISFKKKTAINAGPVKKLTKNQIKDMDKNQIIIYSYIKRKIPTVINSKNYLKFLHLCRKSVLSAF